MNPKIRSMVLTGCAFLTAGSASAANEKKFYIETGMAPLAEQHLPDVGDANIALMKKKAVEVTVRKPASDLSVSEFEAKFLSPKLVEMRNRFLTLKTPDEILGYLDELDRDYETYPNDFKFVAAQLALLRPLSGIVYRLSSLFEGSRVTHSYVLSYISGLFSEMEIFFPSDQWEAMFKYATVPDERTGPKFRDLADFQNFLMSNVNPRMDLAITRLHAIAKTMDTGFYVDKKFLYGPANFALVADRFRAVGPAEIYADLAGLSLAVHNQLVFCAYDQLDLLKVLESLGKLHGKDAILPDRLIGVSAKAYFNRINQYPNFLTLRPSVRTDPTGLLSRIRKSLAPTTAANADDVKGGYGRALMKTALKRMNDVVTFSDAAWSAVQKEPIDDVMPILRPGHYRAFSREGDLRLATWKSLVRGKTTVDSMIVMGDSIGIDLPSFYNKPLDDLKKLFPTGFDPSPAYLTAKLASGSTPYRNYFSGRPIQWDGGKDGFGRFMTGANGAALAPDKVGEGLRILHQAWGGRQAAFPFKFVTE
jgi:hypothetical protein